MKRETKQKIAASVADFRLPRYQEIPNMGLYLEQTSKYISEYLAPLGDYGLTNSMISNYVKKGLVANPVKKQYDREQIAYLFFIAVAKNVLSLDALTDRTALLPGLQLDQPKKAIGRNTIDCMRSGIMMGNACMLDGMIERMEAELGSKTTVIATGGIAKFVVPMCKTPIIYDKDLLVKGLAALYRDNKRA